MSDVLAWVMSLFQMHGISSIKDLPGCAEVKIDDHWYIAANGHKEGITVVPGGMMEVELTPYNFAVWYNGWLAGLFDPFEGIFAAGSAANADAFCAAIKEHLECGGEG